MEVGYSFVEDSFSGTVGAATYLDKSEWGSTRGEVSGSRSQVQLVRPYVRGRPTVQDFANKSRPWAFHRTPGGLVVPVQALNEPNLPHEDFGAGPDEYADWFWKLTDECPEVDFYYAPMSPSDNWRVWYEFGLPRRVIRQRSKGLSVHIYGETRHAKDILDVILPIADGLPIIVSELNFGAGQFIDKDWWARNELPRILDYLSTIENIESVCYFSWKWPRPDGGLDQGTPVDAIGTAVEEVIGRYQS